MFLLLNVLIKNTGSTSFSRRWSPPLSSWKFGLPAVRCSLPPARCPVLAAQCPPPAARRTRPAPPKNHPRARGNSVRVVILWGCGGARLAGRRASGGGSRDPKRGRQINKTDPHKPNARIAMPGSATESHRENGQSPPKNRFENQICG